MWCWIFSAVLFIGGVASCIESSAPESAGAPMLMRWTPWLFWGGIAAIVAGVGVAGWRIADGMAFWLSHG